MVVRWGGVRFWRLSNQGRIWRLVLKETKQKWRCLNSFRKQGGIAVAVGCQALVWWPCWRKGLSSSSPSFVCFMQDPSQGLSADLPCWGPWGPTCSAKGPSLLCSYIRISCHVPTLRLFWILFTRGELTWVVRPIRGDNTMCHGPTRSFSSVPSITCLRQKI